MTPAEGTAEKVAPEKVERTKGERERALEELWRQHRFRLYTPRHIWSLLELSRNFDLKLVRKGKLRVVVPPRLLPDCESCTELCCTGPNAVVSLRLRDIATLCDQGLEKHIVHERPPVTGDADGPTWARQEFDWSVFQRMFPVLARDATGTCSLLTDNRLCSAWPHWPLSCARYPYALDVLNSRVFLAKGCDSHRTMDIDDAPDAIKTLVTAAVESYNARIKDLVLLHTALPQLKELGLLEHLQLEGRLQKRAHKLAA